MNEQQLPGDLKNIKIPDVLPILSLYNAVVFPHMTFPMEVVGERAISLVDEAMGGDRLIGLVMSKKAFTDELPKPDDLYHVGTMIAILKMAKTGDNKAQLLMQGIGRFAIKEFIEGKTYLQATVEALEDTKAQGIEIEALMSNLTGLFDRIVKLSPFLPQEFGILAKSINDPGVLADMIASVINAEAEEKQKVLETRDVKNRLEVVTKIVNHQLEILELGNKIQSQVKTDMDKTQREYYLRQQLKAIREELGETEDDSKVEIQEYRKKVEEKGLSEEAKREADRELSRLERMHPSSAEYTVALTYLDWITSLPWQESTVDNLDIKKARKILDEDHYGLEKAKRRVIEYLAVRKLKPDTKGPILCFAGPPGTGKTSLGTSIARALGRKFVRMSLGGVRDEAEIRGHRRTYVGALPGRIIQGIRRSETNNPVFMLDEIDKLGMDFRGDPSSALLEVLDPEQNFSFSDHYLDVAFDLSHVMFITTANILETIPPALRDRLEVIELLGYTLDEKMKIAEKYLIPRQIEANGLTPKQINFTDAAKKQIISGYTREAGVRNLEREIANVCRGVASEIAKEEIKSASIKVKDLHKYIGPVRITSEGKARMSKPGVAVGLAWTPVGGEILYIEATAMKGNKGLMLTGQLGEIMKESAAAALSFIRTNADKLGIPKDFYDKTDIHIHIPAGAIQKDGPSAGVTILTALASLLTNRHIKKDLAMTGEITLRGVVLPVGGIKEKVLAAHRAGIKTIILPKWNAKDMEDIPENVRSDIEFHLVDEMLDVLKLALAKKESGSGIAKS
ncbi:MAG: endopeptidase La [Syntrophales bacterium]|nr:endopeptidase La [Syntrophales bacterium]MDY0044333.1 endopeptidase La [Syntrophales bacterium]